MKPEFHQIGLAAVWRTGPNGPEVLISRRPAGSHLAGYWEFPGGKVKCDETPEDAARRELAEETGLDVPAKLVPAERLLIVEHSYPDRIVRLHVYLMRLPRFFDGTNHTGIWIPAPELATHSFPPANEPITKAILERLSIDELSR